MNRFSACPLIQRTRSTAQPVSMRQHSPSLLKRAPVQSTGNGFWLVPWHCLQGAVCMDQNHPKMHPISMNSVIAATTSVLFGSLFLYRRYSIKKKKKKGRCFLYFLIKENKFRKYKFKFFENRLTGKCTTVKQNMDCCGVAMNKSFQKYAPPQSAF